MPKPEQPRKRANFSKVVPKLAQDPLFKPRSPLRSKIWLEFGCRGQQLQVAVPVWTFEATSLKTGPAEELSPIMPRGYGRRLRYQTAHSLTNLMIGIARTVLRFLILVALIVLVNQEVRHLIGQFWPLRKFAR